MACRCRQKIETTRPQGGNAVERRVRCRGVDGGYWVPVPVLEMATSPEVQEEIVSCYEE